MYKKIFNLSFIIIIAMVLVPSYAIDYSYDDDFNYNTNNNSHLYPYDPYEKFNKKVFKINLILDKFLLKPVVIVYSNVANDYTKSRVSSFFKNIQAPVSSINYLIQGDTFNAFNSIWKFLINSTLGIAGIFDVALKMGIEVEHKTFSSSLAYYGASPGPYIVMPFIGGFMARDIFDVIFFNNYIKIVYNKNHPAMVTFLVLKIINSRTSVLSITDYLEKNSVDYYEALKVNIFQYYENKMIYPKNYNYIIYNNKTGSLNNEYK